MSEGLPIGLSLGVGSIAPGEGSQVSNYFTSETLQQTDRNTLSPSCHSSPIISHWWDTAADRQEYSLSFLSFFSHYISLVGHCSRQAGILSLNHLLFFCISLVGHCSRQAGILFLLPVILLLLYLTGGTLQQTDRNTLSPSCRSSTVSHW
jgi:hypothetical protein